MNASKHLFPIICSLLLFLTGSNVYSQPIPKNESTILEDRAFKEGLQKTWKKTSLQKTSDTRTKKQTSELPNEEIFEGILPQNELIASYDQEFAEQLRSGNWRTVDFLESPKFSLVKPDFQPFLFEEDKKEPALVSRNSINIKNIIHSKLSLTNTYGKHFPSSINNIRFYGWQFPVIFYDEKIRNYSLNNQEGIGNFWGTLANSKWRLFLKQVQEHAKAMDIEIGDWAYTLLIHKIGNDILCNDRNANIVFTCFMLNHSGLYSKMIRNDNTNTLYLMLPTHDEILNTLYEKDKFHYYYHDFYKRLSSKLEGESTSTPSVNFEPPNTYMKKINSFARALPDLTDNRNNNIVKNFSFKTRSNSSFSFYTSIGLPEKKVTAHINPNRINYYGEIPPTNLKVYFEASCFFYNNARLLQDLGELLLDLDNYEDKINLLLDFTSSNKAFSYKADTKAYFAEETLYQGQTDCEDRAVLFAALAQQLLNVKVLGIEYSDHVIVAIPHKADLPLNSLYFIDYKDEIYILCDPTSSHATYGQISQNRENQRYEVIDFPARCVD